MEPADETSFIAQAMSAGNTYNATRKNFYAGDYTVGDFVSNQYLSRLDFADASQFDRTRNPMEEAENYTGHETIHAAYLRYDQQFGNRLKLIAGLRLEHTAYDYTGNALHVDADEENITFDTDLPANGCRQLASLGSASSTNRRRHGSPRQLHHDARRRNSARWCRATA